MKNVLILCTGNSCRSIIAEAMINHYLADKYTACSAGVNPSTVNPLALQVIGELGIETQGFRSKSVAEFLDRDDLDLVITVCDHAKESCPFFLKPVQQVHLGITDPAPYSADPDALIHFRATRQEIMDKVIAWLKAQ